MPTEGVDWAQIITAGMGAVGAIGLDRAIAYWNERRGRARKAEAEASVVQADAGNRTLEGAFKLIDTLTNQMSVYEKKLDKVEMEQSRLQKLLLRAYARIEYLMNIIKTLTNQLRQKGVEPCIEPDQWKPEE